MKDKLLKAVGKTAFLLFVGGIFFLNSCKTSNEEKNESENIKQDSTEISEATFTIESLTTMLRHDPLNADLFAKRAGLRSFQNQFDEAINDIALAIRLDSLNPIYYTMQAEYFIYGGQPNSAKKGLTQCLNLFPGNTDIMLKLAEIHFYLKEYSQAKTILREVVTLNDNLGQIYFLQGLILLENKDSTNAIRNLRFAIEKDPEFYSAYMMLGRVHAGMHNNLSIDYYRAAIDIIPDSYEARYNLALYLQDHNYQVEAENEYNYIIQEVDSTVANPYYNLGYIHLIYKQDFEKAIEFFTTAINKEHNYIEAWYNRGFTYEIMGKLKLARADYNKSLDIQTNYPLSIKGLNRLDDGKPFKY
ncbi:MAG: tetratricopeptide repeat protein [Bacteroidales bacterium]|nr:tetratricopeptide repeat protein [Bacteroidales bacterium]